MCVCEHIQRMWQCALDHKKRRKKRQKLNTIEKNTSYTSIDPNQLILIWYYHNMWIMIVINFKTKYFVQFLYFILNVIYPDFGISFITKTTIQKNTYSSSVFERLLCIVMSCACRLFIYLLLFMIIVIIINIIIEHYCSACDEFCLHKLACVYDSKCLIY